MSEAAEVVVVGAGVSGLVCAFAFQRVGKKVLVIEASERAGGLIRSERRDGYLVEHGPQSFSGTAALRELCRELSIAGELLEADPRAPRYVLVNGKLTPVPLGPFALLASSLLSLETKRSLLREPFSRTTPPAEDESIAAFVRRKFSDELLDRLVGPFVSGIYAGDPERLSLRSTFPQLYEAEKAKGSLLRGMLAASRTKQRPRERATLLTFREGNETLIRALAQRLGPALRCGAEVGQIESAGSSRFALTVQAKGGREQIEAEQIVVAAPPDRAGRLLAALDAEFARVLGGIEFAPVAVVSLGYERGAIEQGLEGFGFLVPRSAGMRVLGTVWNSSLFPGRAPGGYALLTSFVGGATDPGVASLEGETLAEITHREISGLLGIRGQPVFSSVQIYGKALPQYNLGHGERLARLEALRAEHRGLWFTGNYLRGPAIGACVEQALAVAGEVAAAAHPNSLGKPI